MRGLSIGPLPDVLAPLAFLLGTWRGEGEGDYPTIESFRYGEELAFEHVGDEFLLYRQASWLLPGGDPLHFERGFLRPGAQGGSVELTLAHPLGLTEVSEGVVDGPAMELKSLAVGRTHTGSAVSGLRRRYRLADGWISYELEMEMDETPMTRHLQGRLRRVQA
jgi:THAP4-like, heme-binding beta-barrel domain